MPRFSKLPLVLSVLAAAAFVSPASTQAGATLEGFTKRGLGTVSARAKLRPLSARQPARYSLAGSQVCGFAREVSVARAAKSESPRPRVAY